VNDADEKALRSAARTSAPPTVAFAERTDVGRRRDENQDAVAHADFEPCSLFVVCDGMGGHAGGSTASRLAADTILATFATADPDLPHRERLERAILAANKAVFQAARSDRALKGMGTTAVTLLLDPDEGTARIAHVGDSRAYLVHAGAISQITRDHSMVQEMVERNLIRAEEAQNHPDANKILRALGIAKDVEVEVRRDPVPYVAGDLLVLCSDGLSDLVGASEILEVAGSSPPAQAAGQLVDLANARGGHDNITVMIVRFQTTAESREAATIVKTMQLTAHEAVAGPPAVAVPPQAGPKGTLLSTPAREPARAGGSSGTARLAPLPEPSVAGAPGPAAAPPAGAGPSIPQPPPVHRSADPRSRLPIVVGIALAAIGLAILVVFLWNERRPQHHTPMLVDDLVEGGAPGSPRTTLIDEDDDGQPDPLITPSPPLEAEAPSAAAPTWWPKDDAGARPPELADCDRAKRAKERGLPPAGVAHLEERCRAAGGTP
jgi:PPM family protein phosphatase